MRTTFTLDDDAAELAQNYAQARSLRLGQAVSELIRRASAPQPPLELRRRGQVWVLQAPAASPRLTSEQVKAMLEDSP